GLAAAPLPVARFHPARQDVRGGIALRTTAGDPQSVDIVFMDETGADLSQAAQRKLERVFTRQEYRRAFPGEIAELSFPARAVDTYARELPRCVDIRRVTWGNMKVVVDCADGTASFVQRSLRRQAGVVVLTVNDRLDDAAPTEPLAARRRDLQRLAELVASSRAAFGVRFDPVGE